MFSVKLYIELWYGDCWRGRQSWTPLLFVILQDAMSVDVDVRHRLGNRIANCNVDVGVRLGRLVWCDILEMRCDGWTLAIGVAKVSGLTRRTIRSRCRMVRMSDTELLC